MNKFFNLSLVALICATLFTSCENNGNQNNNDSKEGNISQNVLVANLPQNFKATTKYTLTSVMNTRTEANSTLTKFGADWILDYDFFSTDVSGVETRQSRVYYLRFDENGKILKQFESADEGKNWAVMDKYLDFSHFAESGSNTARRLLDKSLKTSYGCQIDMWTATGEKRTVCNRTCTEYEYKTAKSVYLVDDATHLVFHEDFNDPDTETVSEFAVLSWNENISSVGYNLPK